MNDLEKTNESESRSIQPACSICEEEGKVRLSVEMPGVNRDGIEVNIDKNELIIVGKNTHKESDGKYLLRERRRGDFRKRFIIDETIDRDKIEATVTNGVLTLSLNLKEAAKPRKVEIH